MNFHHTAAPVACAGASVVLGFDLHAVLGIIGQIVGILSGVASLGWVGYQFYLSRKGKS